MKYTAMAAAALAAMIGANAAHADDGDKKDREKCYGIAKAGKNDCASKDGSNSCAGQATKDGDKNSWIYVPAGLCTKINGGMKG